MIVHNVHRRTSAIGMTGSTLDTTFEEHVRVSYRTGASLTLPPHSAIRDHRDICGTPFETSNIKILENVYCTSDRKILESLHISKTKPLLNNYLTSYLL